MSFDRAEHCRSIAKLGGDAVKKKYGREHFKKIGRRGGRSVVATYGNLYMSSIGKKGFRATCDRHFNGDVKAMVEDLVKRGLWVLDEPARISGWFWQAERPDIHPANKQK